MLGAIWLSLALLLAAGAGASPPASLETFREAVRRAAAGDHRLADSLKIESSGWNWSQEINLRDASLCGSVAGDPATVIIVSRHLGGQMFLFDSAGNLKASVPVTEPVSSEPRDLNGDGLMEVLLEQVDGYGTGLYETGYHVYAFDTGKPRELWSAPALWSWSNSDPESGRGFLRFERRWGTPGPIVLYVMDGKRDGKAVHRREAWEYAEGVVRKTAFPQTPGA